ncbi:MAG: hypothetical protein ACRDL6_07395, partial [Solirubrobacterales bacterium]
MERGQLGEGRRALQRRLGLTRLALIITAAAALAFPGAAAALERISSPFLLEYSSPTYTVDQGELVVFENRDPFLRHGLSSDAFAGSAPLFSAPVIPRGEARLVRGVPFLRGSGTPFGFRDPAHPGMTSVLVIGPAGIPLPPDVLRPSARVRIRSGALGRVARSGVLRLVLAPSEPVDATVVAKLGRRRLGRAQRTYVAAGGYRLRLRLSTGPLRGRASAKI